MTLSRRCAAICGRFPGAASNPPQSKKNAVLAVCGRRRSAGVRRGEITSLEVASIAFVWSPAQPPPAFRLFAGHCPTPHFYERLEENIKAGNYALSRPFVMATKGEISEQKTEVQALFDYLSSDEGKALIKSVGLITVD